MKDLFRFKYSSDYFQYNMNELFIEKLLIRNVIRKVFQFDFVQAVKCQLIFSHFLTAGDRHNGLY